MSRAPGLVFDHAYRQHDPGTSHPESPDRYLALAEAFRNSNWLNRAVRIPAREATEDEIHLCHTRHYYEVVKHDIARGSRTLSTGDTNLSPASLEVARMATGGVLAAVDAVLQGRVPNAFAAVRPPGHHATASRGMGFCIFNHIAIAARYAQKRLGVDRVAIVDWDVHHGNGTQDIFYEDSSVFFFSTHQWPWYPGTGSPDETGVGPAKGTTMNCPFPAGAGHSEILGAFRKKLLPALDGFRPGLILVSAGFDSRRGDPLGRFLLSDGDFRELTEIVLEAADKHAGGRVVSVLEGGYSLTGLPAASVAHLEALHAAPVAP